MRRSSSWSDGRLALAADGRIARLTLTGGDRGNAIDLAFARSFEGATSDLLDRAQAGELDVVVVAAEGRMFCVGGDLADFPSDPDAVVDHLARMAGLMHHGLELLVQIPVPVVVRVQGVAAGAGLGLVAAGDIVIASSVARFRSAYTAVGLSPDLGVSWLLPRVVGARRAADMVLTNQMVSAEQAEAWGLVSRVVAPDRLDDTVDGIVDALAAMPTGGLVESKRLLASAADRPLVEHLDDEAATIAWLSATAGARQAREQFLSRS